MKPAYKSYCDCLGTSIYSGDKISEATKTCGTYLKYEFKKGLSKTIQWFSNAENLAKYKTGIYTIWNFWQKYGGSEMQATTNAS